MTRLHTAFRGRAPRSAGDRRRNEDSSRKPTPAGRAARPTAPPRAGAAGFGRLRAVSACSGVERVVGGVRRATGGVAGSRRLAGARRGRAAGVRCRSRRGEPVRSREAVCRHAGQWSGGDGVPSSAIGGGAVAAHGRVVRRPPRWSFRVAFRVFPTRTRAQALRRSEAHPSLAAYRHRPGRRTVCVQVNTRRAITIPAETPAWSTGFMPPIMHALSTVLIHGSLRPHPP